MAKKAAAAIDPMSIIEDAAKDKPVKKSASKTPEVQIDTPEVKAAIERFKKAHLAAKEADAAKAEAEVIIMQPALEEKRKVSRRDGKFQTSVVVNGAIMISTTNKYGIIDPANADALKEIFEDDYDKYFTKATDIALTDLALKDPEVLTKLINAVGKDKFRDYFEVKQHLSPTEALHHDRELDPEIGERADKAVEQGILRPYKPVFKPR